MRAWDDPLTFEPEDNINFSGPEGGGGQGGVGVGEVGEQST